MQTAALQLGGDGRRLPVPARRCVGIRATPGVLIVPWQPEPGLARSTISLAIAINVFLYGLMGPFAAACMQRFGIRRNVLSALAVLAVGGGGQHVG